MRYIDLDKLLLKRKAWGSAQNLWTQKKLKDDFKEFGHQKCWYSEVGFVGFDVDIDHFRPKNRVERYPGYDYNNEISTVGYHWLKEEPSNYRASCIYANRPRENGGKWDYFPLKKGSPHLTQGGKEIEEPMLLDPCNREDVKLLTFESGNATAATHDTHAKERVKVSIKLYNLNAPGIRTERNRVWDKVIRYVNNYNLGKMTKDVCVEEIKELISRDALYSACAIACVKSCAPQEILDELGSDLEL